MDPNTPNEPCKRCKKAGRQCIVTQPSRRRQKKSDTRVAELERKIDALTAVIAQQNGSSYPPQHHPAPEQYTLAGDQGAEHQTMAGSMNLHEQKPDISTAAPTQAYMSHVHPDFAPMGPEPRGNKRRRVESTSESASAPVQTVESRRDFKRADLQHTEGWKGLHQELHIVFPQQVREKIRSLVQPELMHRLFDHYCTHLAPIMPVVTFPAGTTADDIIESKPILLLAIMAISCIFIVTPEMRQALYEEVLSVFADAVIIKGAKSLDVIQALQVTVLWQKPPEKPHSANFYGLIHISAVMALDLGLGKSFNPAKTKRGFGGPGSDLPPGPMQNVVDSDTMEARRAWMVSYFMCAAVSQFLRRPNLLRWSNYMNQCVTLLETSPDAAPGDRLLAAHIKLQHICEEINQSFALDDPEATSISILDPKVAYTLNVLEAQLRDWEASLPVDMRKPELLFSAHSTKLYLHEIALHVNHNTDDFRVPFTEASLKSGSENGFAATLTQNQMTSIEACLRASHASIETYCTFDLDTQTILPPLLYFVRIVYALIVLIKLHVAVTSPGSELGKIIKPEDVKVEEYLNRLWENFEALKKQQAIGPHHKAQHILGILRDWVGTHREGDVGASATKPLQDAGMPAPGQSKTQQERYPPRSKSDDDSLRVLSEAATAGAKSQHQPHAQQQQSSQQRQGSASWGFESPSAVPYPPYNMRGNNQQGGYPQDGGTPATTSTVMTPGPYPNDGYNNNNNMFSTQQQGFGKGNDIDWAAGMDFEQAVNVALQEMDFSGDLFGEFCPFLFRHFHFPSTRDDPADMNETGSFFGNGADAYQIPPDNMGGSGSSNLGGGGSSNNNNSGGRW